MAQYDGGTDTFMTDQLKTGLGRRTIASFDVPAPWSAPEPEFKDVEALSTPGAAGGTWNQASSRAAAPQREFSSAGVLEYGPEHDWFEHVHVFPASINAGIVLATEVYTVDVYNAYREDARTLNSFTNNAGSGITFAGLPSLPSAIEPQSGFTLTVTIAPEGPAFFNDTIDFAFDVVTLETNLSGQRSILFPHEPERPIIETLMWETDIRTSRNGKETRAALREVPRSEWRMTFLASDGARRALETNLISSQAQTFGVPMWWEGMSLTSAITATDTVINVSSTDYLSLSVGGLAMVWTDYNTFEALEIASFTGNTITFTSGFTAGFPAGTLVMPVRLGVLTAKSQRGRRWPQNLQEVTLVFTSADNDVDLADTSAWNSYNSKVLFDDPNMVEGTVQESQERAITVIDNATGDFQIKTEWPLSRRVHAKKWFTKTRQGLREVREVLHALKGPATSFYIPTFYPDLIATTAIGSGDSFVRVENQGYTKFINAAAPRNVIRLVKTDGTTVVREVTSASEISSTEEQLTLDSAWGVAAALADIDQIEFVEKARISSDRVRIRHTNSSGQAVITAPIIDVME